MVDWTLFYPFKFNIIGDMHDSFRSNISYMMPIRINTIEKFGKSWTVALDIPMAFDH